MPTKKALNYSRWQIRDQYMLAFFGRWWLLLDNHCCWYLGQSVCSCSLHFVNRGIDEHPMFPSKMMLPVTVTHKLALQWGRPLVWSGPDLQCVGAQWEQPNQLPPCLFCGRDLPTPRLHMAELADSVITREGARHTGEADGKRLFSGTTRVVGLKL